ncbi:hypothetical protein EJ02DRAFT_458851 [Clathrospora elynae]|uniref:Uncharacterized protein n=1 Tax=Clathrospora elynae TaxID=706981 RepID=A0A6A5S9P0_9PLEO|nr:hypothetical protein EJ02DRAFT_458851 [Clathrospora elynae]
MGCGRRLRSKSRTARKARTLLTKLEDTLRKSSAEIESHVRAHAVQSKRIHAEIQLLFYYESNSSILLPPRVICSNKHACFLCNLFIKTHGRFYIRSCHGRLYPRWRIPLLEEMQWPEPATIRMQEAIDELNRQLELKIRQYLDQTCLKISDPQESVIFVPDVYTPSMLSAAAVAEPNIDMAITRATEYSHCSTDKHPPH